MPGFFRVNPSRELLSLPLPRAKAGRPPRKSQRMPGNSTGEIRERERERERERQRRGGGGTPAETLNCSRFSNGHTKHSGNAWCALLMPGAANYTTRSCAKRNFAECLLKPCTRAFSELPSRSYHHRHPRTCRSNNNSASLSLIDRYDSPSHVSPPFSISRTFLLRDIRIASLLIKYRWAVINFMVYGIF